MKPFRMILAVSMLLLASLACNTALGGGDGNNEAAVDTDFPMTADAYDVMDMGDGSLLYYTKLPLEDVMQFYRDEYAARGYTERQSATTVSGGIFSLVFDGDPSGKAVVIQSVDLGDGSRTVAIRLEGE